MTGFAMQRKEQKYSLPVSSDYHTTVDDARPRSFAMDSQGLKIRNMEYVFGRHYDARSPYMALSEASSRSTQAYEYADSSSQACHSENESFYDSPLPASPMMNSLHPSFHSPSSSGGFPSPSNTQLNAATAPFHHSPNLIFDVDTPSPRTSSEEQRTKSSSSSSSSCVFFPPKNHTVNANPALSRTQPGRDYPVCCLYPGCTAKPFKRRADLDRHYKHRHASDAQKVSFNCDYPRCSRRRDPFHRLDHFRDHLREFHKEDIEKRGGSANEEWLEDRRVSSTWWRCSKCLNRIYIEQNGYECPNCKSTCQAKRKEARRRS